MIKYYVLNMMLSLEWTHGQTFRFRWQNPHMLSRGPSAGGAPITTRLRAILCSGCNWSVPTSRLLKGVCWYSADRLPNESYWNSSAESLWRALPADL